MNIFKNRWILFFDQIIAQYMPSTYKAESDWLVGIPGFLFAMKKMQ